jgi:hypothetical protein
VGPTDDVANAVSQEDKSCACSSLGIPGDV